MALCGDSMGYERIKCQLISMNVKTVKLCLNASIVYTENPAENALTAANSNCFE